jgi:hypothetical protein
MKFFVHSDREHFHAGIYEQLMSCCQHIQMVRQCEDMRRSRVAAKGLTGRGPGVGVQALWRTAERDLVDGENQCACLFGFDPAFE